MIHIWNQVCQGIAFIVSSFWPSTRHLIEYYTETRDADVLRVIGRRKNAISLLMARYRAATQSEIPRVVDTIEEMLREALSLQKNEELIAITPDAADLPKLQLFMCHTLEGRPDTTITDLARFIDNSSLVAEDRHIVAGYVYFKIEYAEIEELTRVVFELDPQSKFWQRAAGALMRSSSYDPAVCKRVRERRSSRGAAITIQGGENSRYSKSAHT